jgi:hypothetical protein
VSSKSKNKTEVGAISVSEEAQRLALFGRPLLLEGENAAAYDDFLIRIRAAVNPVDIIDDMFIADVVSLEWDVLRWRRLKWALMREAGFEQMKLFLIAELESNYDLHEEHFKTYLATILQINFPRNQADSLAAECAPNTVEANNKLAEVLSSIGQDTDMVLEDARAEKAKELMQEYVRGEPDAMTLIHKLFTNAGVGMDKFMADALAVNLDDIERIDHLTTIAESRRNSSLREIDRRRAVLGQTLRRRVQEIEDAEFRVIETTPANRENAA